MRLTLACRLAFALLLLNLAPLATAKPMYSVEEKSIAELQADLARGATTSAALVEA